MNMDNPIYLNFVDIKDGTQSNKFYNMIPTGDGNFRAEYGRIGSTKQIRNYPMSRWNSTYNSKLKKGYTDITDLKKSVSVIKESIDNKDFEEFYNHFSKYASLNVQSIYQDEGCTQAQIDAAQELIDKISKQKKIDDINDLLLQLYKTIPRKMKDVRDHLITKKNEKNSFIQIEQDALDSMSSVNIINESNPFKDLNIEFSEASKAEYKKLNNLIVDTMNRYNHGVKIHKVYKLKTKKLQSFENWVSTQDNKQTELLFHGTRNPNIFSIMKSGLVVRPSNAAYISGNSYGNGIYHSKHTAKSLNYCGHDPDKIFFIQDVHMGNHYTYDGWYSDGKDISRSQMTFEGLKKLGNDSLYVKPSGGLLNSEYIVYKSEQTCTKYLVWFK